MTFKKRSTLFVLIITLLLSSFSFTASAAPVTPFTDVPSGHWSYDLVNRLQELNITNGIGNNKFGLGLTITRGEFVTFLVRLMGWNIAKPAQ